MVADEKYALLIGASHFVEGGPKALTATEADVAELQDALYNPEIGNFKRGNIKNAINCGADEAQRLLLWLYEDRDSSDLLILYYTGHGLCDQRTNKLYLALQSTTVASPKIASLSANWIKEEIRLSKSSRKLVILDCCHSGLFGAAGGLSKSGNRKFLTEETFVPKGSGCWTLASSTAAQASLVDLEIDRSIFTSELVEALNTGAASPDKTNLSVSDLAQYLQERVRKRSQTLGGLMEPELLGQGTSPLIIAGNPRPKRPIPTEFIDALRDPDELMRRGAISKFSAYIFDTKSMFRDEARDLLARRLVAGGENHFELRGQIKKVLDASVNDRDSSEYIEDSESKYSNKDYLKRFIEKNARILVFSLLISFILFGYFYYKFDFKGYIEKFSVQNISGDLLYRIKKLEEELIKSKQKEAEYNIDSRTDDKVMKSIILEKKKYIKSDSPFFNFRPGDLGSINAFYCGVDQGDKIDKIIRLTSMLNSKSKSEKVIDFLDSITKLKIVYDHGDYTETEHCGGTVISDRMILTAAHCVSSPDERKWDKIEVLVGSNDLNDSNIFKTSSTAAICHAGFDYSYLANDVAIIITDHTIPNYIKKIPIDPFRIPSIHAGQEAIAAGWPVTGMKAGQTVLNKTLLEVSKVEWPGYITAAAASGGIDGICRGESGGPIFAMDNDEISIAGVSSGIEMGTENSNGEPCMKAGYEMYFTPTSAYSQWIQSVVQLCSDNPDECKSEKPVSAIKVVDVVKPLKLDSATYPRPYELLRPGIWPDLSGAEGLVISAP